MNYGGVILDDYKKIDEITSKQLRKILSKISFSNKTIFVIDKTWFKFKFMLNYITEEKIWKFY